MPSDMYVHVEDNKLKRFSWRFEVLRQFISLNDLCYYDWPSALVSLLQLFSFFFVHQQVKEILQMTGKDLNLPVLRSLRPCFVPFFLFIRALSCFIPADYFCFCCHQCFIFYNEAHSIIYKMLPLAQSTWDALCIHDELQHESIFQPMLY